MGLKKALTKAAKIAVAPAKNIVSANRQLLKGNVKGALKSAGRAAIAPITQPMQFAQNAPGMSAVRNALPGANRLQAGFNRIAGNPLAAQPRRPAPQAAPQTAPAGAALQGGGGWEAAQAARAAAPQQFANIAPALSQAAASLAPAAPKKPMADMLAENFGGGGFTGYGG